MQTPGTQGSGPGRRTKTALAQPASAPRACPAAAGWGVQATATARPSARGLLRAGPACSRRAEPGGRLPGRGREGGSRPTHVCTRPSASSAPSPPYRGTCLQQPRHIRAGPARLLRRPRLLPGRCLGPEVRPGRARVTWRVDVVRGRGPRRFSWRSRLQGSDGRSPGSRTFLAGLTLGAAARAGPWSLPMPCGRAPLAAHPVVPL